MSSPSRSGRRVATSRTSIPSSRCATRTRSSRTGEVCKSNSHQTSLLPMLLFVARCVARVHSSWWYLYTTTGFPKGKAAPLDKRLASASARSGALGENREAYGGMVPLEKGGGQKGKKKRK